MHGDHLGDKRISKTGNGTCAKPKTEIKMTPNSNTAAIIVGKKANAFLGGEMHKFMQKKVKLNPGQRPLFLNVSLNPLWAHLSILFQSAIVSFSPLSHFCKSS